jgi:hypothetical protein
MRLAIVPIADAWASRELRICIRDYAVLSASARRLVDHLRG